MSVLIEGVGDQAAMVLRVKTSQALMACLSDSASLALLQLDRCSEVLCRWVSTQLQTKMGCRVQQCVATSRCEPSVFLKQIADLHQVEVPGMTHGFRQAWNQLKMRCASLDDGVLLVLNAETLSFVTLLSVCYAASIGCRVILAGEYVDTAWIQDYFSCPVPLFSMADFSDGGRLVANNSQGRLNTVDLSAIEPLPSSEVEFLGGVPLDLAADKTSARVVPLVESGGQLPVIDRISPQVIGAVDSSRLLAKEAPQFAQASRMSDRKVVVRSPSRTPNVASGGSHWNKVVAQKPAHRSAGLLLQEAVLNSPASTNRSQAVRQSSTTSCRGWGASVLGGGLLAAVFVLLFVLQPTQSIKPVANVAVVSSVSKSVRLARALPVQHQDGKRRYISLPPQLK